MIAPWPTNTLRLSGVSPATSKYCFSILRTMFSTSMSIRTRSSDSCIKESRVPTCHAEYVTIVRNTRTQRRSIKTGWAARKEETGWMLLEAFTPSNQRSYRARARGGIYVIRLQRTFGRENKRQTSDGAIPLHAAALNTAALSKRSDVGAVSKVLRTVRRSVTKVNPTRHSRHGNERRTEPLSKLGFGSETCVAV